jgi:hypothetical protein
MNVYNLRNLLQDLGYAGESLLRPVTRPMRDAWRRFRAPHYGPIKFVTDIDRVVEMTLRQSFPMLREQELNMVTEHVTIDVVKAAGTIINDAKDKIGKAIAEALQEKPIDGRETVVYPQ